MSLFMILAAAAAGGIGAVLRYVVGALTPVGAKDLPRGILIVNVTGSFALGVLTGLGSLVPPELAFVLGVGLLGGYTTFSTVSVETILLTQGQRPRGAALYLVGTAVLAILAASAGLSLGAWIVGADHAALLGA